MEKDSRDSNEAIIPEIYVLLSRSAHAIGGQEPSVNCLTFCLLSNGSSSRFLLSSSYLFLCYTVLLRGNENETEEKRDGEQPVILIDFIIIFIFMLVSSQYSNNIVMIPSPRNTK